MPNRILREGLLDSEPLSKAGELAEVLFMRLILIVDDFGRFDGRVSVICRRCWPIGHPTDPSAIDVLERLVKLTEQKLVVAYEIDGKPFIYIPKFKQRTRAPKSKFPDPPTSCPQDDGPLTAQRLTDDGPLTAVGARSSSFVVRSSDSNAGANTRGSTSTPKAAAHSIARTQQNKRDLEQAAASQAEPPEWTRKFVKSKPAPTFEEIPDGLDTDPPTP